MNDEDDVEIVMHPVQVVRFKDEAQDLTQDQKLILTRQEEAAFNEFVAGRLAALPPGHYPAVYHAILQELSRLIVYRMADSAEVRREDDGQPLDPGLPPVVRGTASALAAVSHAMHALGRLVQQDLESRFGETPKS